MEHSTDDRPSRFPWPPVLLAGAIGAALAADRYLIRLPVPFAGTAPGHYVGMTMLLAGAMLMVWAALEFRRHETSIRPDRGSEALVARGPFAFSRNPIYLAEIIALGGAGLAFDRLWLMLVAPVFAALVTRLAIRREEAYLERRFGVAYADYKARVRRWI